MFKKNSLVSDCVISALLVLVFSATGFAASLIPETPESRDSLSQDLEQGRIGIVTGGPGGTYLKLGSDLSKLMRGVHGNKLRVIVQEGGGSKSNLVDLAFLKYVDLVLVQADVLAHIQSTDRTSFNYLKDRIGYVARFHPEVIHILASGGPFKSVDALRGKRVAIGSLGSGTQITARQVLSGYDIKFLDMHQKDALAALSKGDPNVDAMVYVAGLGSSLLTDIDSNFSTGNISFVPLRQEPLLQTPYEKVQLTQEDYVHFIDEGQVVDAWAVPAVLAAYDWSNSGSAAGKGRNQRVSRFIESFFLNSHKLNDGPGGYNSNWCSIDLTKTLAGWNRIPAASQWLKLNSLKPGGICGKLAHNVQPQAPAKCPAFIKFVDAEDDMSLSDTNLLSIYRLWKLSNPGKC